MPPIIDDTMLGIRSHDVQPGLCGVTMGLINRYMRKTKLVGAAAQLAVFLRGRDEVVDWEGFLTAAGELGLEDLLAHKALRVLEAVEYVRVVGHGEVVRKIECSIPVLSDLYRPLGEYMREGLHPEELELAALNALELTANVPITVGQLRDKLGLDDDAWQILENIGQNAQFLDTYQSATAGEPVVYTPLYWDEHPDRLFELGRTLGIENLLSLLQDLRSYQGKPTDLIQDPYVLEAVGGGLFPAPAVASLAGTKHFLFTPGPGVQPYEKVVLEKARAIVACVRYGETFGTITRIRNPVDVLRALLERGQVGPHTEIQYQYKLLKDLNIADIVPSGLPDRHFLRLVDADENRVALTAAIDMLTAGATPLPRPEHGVARGILSVGRYVPPTEARAFVKRIPTVTPGVVRKINDMLLGVSHRLT